MKTRRNFFKAAIAAIAGIPIVSTIARASESPGTGIIPKWRRMSAKEDYLKNPIVQIRREDVRQASRFTHWKKVTELPKNTAPKLFIASNETEISRLDCTLPIKKA